MQSNSKDKCLVETVHKRPSKGVLPTLLNFQNGTFAIFDRKNSAFCQMLNEKKKTKEAMVVASNNVFHGEMENNDLTDEFVCVRNKITNKVCIIPIDKVRLKNNIYDKLSNKKIGSLSTEAKEKQLFKEFGGRKAARYIANKESMKINAEDIKDNLEQTFNEADTTQLDDTVDSILVQNFERLRPNFSKDATRIDNVYKIFDVVPEELLDRLGEEANAVLATGIDDLPIDSKYLLGLIKDVQSREPEPNLYLKLKLILYMDALLNLIAVPVRTIDNIEISQISEKIENNVLELFTDAIGQKFKKTKFLEEKAICYFIVLCLLTSNNYSVDLSILLENLKLPKAKVIKLAHIVHAKLKGDRMCLHLPSQMSILSSSLKQRKKHAI